MIALLLLQAVLGPIGRQELPAQGCAAYLWTVAEPRELVAMAEPARLRITLDGKPLDLARASAEGQGGLGLATTTRYAAGDISATLDITLVERGDIAKGAIAPEASLTIRRGTGDATVAPLAGMVGCR